MTRVHWAVLLLIAAVGVLLFALPAHSASTAPTFTLGNVTVLENAGSVQLVIHKSAKANSYSKVTVQTVDGTAKAGVDYQPVNITITFGNSSIAQTVAVPIINNSAYQGSRSFTVKLVPVRFAAVTQAPATVTINDDERPVPTATWTKCATETQTCYVVGTANVRYGSGSTWTAPRPVTGSILCDNSVFGDPLFGVVKECYTDGAVGTGPAPTPTPTPVPPPPAPPPALPVSAPLGDQAVLNAAVGSTMHAACPVPCSALPNADFTYGSLYSAGVLDGAPVRLLGWFLDAQDRVKWHVALADGRDGWLFSDQLAP